MKTSIIILFYDVLIRLFICLYCLVSYTLQRLCTQDYWISGNVNCCGSSWDYLPDILVHSLSA